MNKSWKFKDAFGEYSITAKTSKKEKSNYNISLSVYYGGSYLTGAFEREDSTEEYLLREGLRMLDRFKEEEI